MRRKIKVSVGFSGVIPTGSFQNSKPTFSAEEEFEIEGGEKEADLVFQTRHEELYRICRDIFNTVSEQEKLEKIKNDRKDFRFYKTPDGQEYISVTSFLGYDKDFFCNAEELKQYAAQGSLIDAEVRNFIKTGVWKDSSQLEGCAADRFIVKTGSKKLALSGWNFLGFLEKYPIKNLKSHEKPLFNPVQRYAGTPDLEGEYEGIPTLVSLKRTLDDVSNLMQEAAYAKCEGMEHIKQIMVIPLKAEQDGGNKQGWGKPIINQDIDRYFELVTYKRKEFQKVYGI